MPETSTTHFGFKTVTREEKAQRVRGVFNSVAQSYDRMNDAMSLGAHRIWKRDFTSTLSLRDGMKILDLAGGTGDIAFLMQRHAEANITICDINHEMLRVGQERAKKRGLMGLNWTVGNAEELPLPGNHYDRCSIAFGIRNVTNIPKALSEIHRVLKPGGMFACLEFSDVKSEWLKPIYDRYSFDLIPKLGELIADDRDSYQYLVESIRRFPNQLHFKQMIAEAGFEQVSHRNLSGGIVAIHKGWKI